MGMILRETPHIFSAIAIANDIENGALSTLDVSPWARMAVSVVAGERSRLREEERESRTQKTDSKHALNTLMGGSHV